MNANLVILLFLGSPFIWDKVFKVLGPLPNQLKNQRLFVHILFYILHNGNWRYNNGLPLFTCKTDVNTIVTDVYTTVYLYLLLKPRLIWW